LADGTVSTTLVQPSRPWIEVQAREGAFQVARVFVFSGVEHILLGYDHLLFVLALVLIVRGRRVLVATITAFTVAHSITLSLATLGVVHVPGPPVEATIALSILLLACEIVRLQRGNPSLTAQWPWVIAFSFGLLHGFGFAGVLSEIGLPAGEVPLALFAFNVGVEVGQLVFIAAVLPLLALARRPWVFAVAGRPALTAAPYAIGILAAFWFCERVAAFWA
jgi:hydrogenase/urease accessory protein HupE